MAKIRVSEAGRFYDPDTINLEAKTYPKNIQWAVDYDYINKLSLEERQWLSQFSHEYYKAGVNKDDPDTIHQTDEGRKDCYNRSNTSRRDLYSILECRGGMMVIDPQLVSRLFEGGIKHLNSYIQSREKHPPKRR